MKSAEKQVMLIINVGFSETERIASEALMTLHVEGELSCMCDVLHISDVVQRKARALWKELQPTVGENTNVVIIQVTFFH